MLDLTRRVITTIGLDVELMATPEFARTSRRDQLGAFLDAVAAYVDVDGDASLAGLLGYLQAESEQGAGLEQAVPSDREAVKLLTVHKAKGLEWEACSAGPHEGRIPQRPGHRQLGDESGGATGGPARGRGLDPQLAEATYAGMIDYKQQLNRQQLLAEDRLAYVAVTRAKRLLVGTGHSWRSDLSNARAASSYLQAIIEEAIRHDQLLAEAAPPGPDNPLVSEVPSHLACAPRSGGLARGARCRAGRAAGPAALRRSGQLRRSGERADAAR